ncbi:MAG: LCP family protein [Microgenomates group bacterium]
MKESLRSRFRQAIQVLFSLTHLQKTVLIGAVLIGTVVSTYFVVNHQQIPQVDAGEVLGAQPGELALTDLPADPILEDTKVITILLLGYGGAGHQGGMLSDAIQVASIDFEKKQISLISIPRDLSVTLPGVGEQKINEAFSLGTGDDVIESGAQLAKQMAQAVTGIPVHYYAAIDFVGLKRLIGEEFDGITVQVEETLDDPWYPISGSEQDPCGHSAEEIATFTNTLSGFELEKQFECRYEHIYFPVGEVEMNGGDALAFVRSRHGSAGGDFSRSRRQWSLLLAIKDELFAMDALSAVEPTYRFITDHVSTDVDLEFLKKIAPALTNADKFEIKRVGISTENILVSSRNGRGQFVLYPKSGTSDWESVQDFVARELE